VEVVVAGNPTVDIVITRSGTARRLGGPAYYISLALGALGARARVVGIASPDVIAELKSALAGLGVELRLDTAECTTTFELDYRTSPRRVRLLRRPPRRVEMVEGSVVILSPVYDELAGARVRAERAAADLQGYIRARVPFPRADLVHLSHDDLSLSEREILELAENWRSLVYTLGEGGAYVATGGRLYYINSARLKVEDATGGGDVFLAVLAYLHLVQGVDLLQSACEASKYAAGFLAARAVAKYEYECRAVRVARPSSPGPRLAEAL
jgi:sugar/nucleoside kinase (ribokinase family)